jgi:hypothetical protein
MDTLRASRRVIVVGGIRLDTYCQAGVLLPRAGLRQPSAFPKFKLNLEDTGEWLGKFELGPQRLCGAKPLS